MERKMEERIEYEREADIQAPTDRERSRSPEETKRSVKDKVAKGIAAVAGALEGFNEQMRKDDLPEKAKQSVEKAGEATRKVAQSTRSEFKDTKKEIGGGSSGGPGEGSGSGGGQSGKTLDVHKEPSVTEGPERRLPERQSPPGKPGSGGQRRI